MIHLKVDKYYDGPTILEMASLLPLSDEPVTVAWGNTKPEVRLLRQYPSREVTLVVADAAAMERAATALGLRYELGLDLLRACSKAINLPTGTRWRDFVSGVGGPLSRGVMLQLVADAIRKGKDPTPLRKLTLECLLDNTPSIEADVLLGIRMKGAQLDQ